MRRIIKLAVCLAATTLVSSALMAGTSSLTEGVGGYTGYSQGEIRGYIWGGGGYTTPGYAYANALFMYRSWTPGYKSRVFLKWDLSGIVPAGQTVTSAKLVMTSYAQVDNSGGNTTINLHKALQPWTEGQVTWMNWSNGGRTMDPATPPYGVLEDPNPNYVGQVMGSIPTMGNAAGQYTIDLDTSAVMDWVANPTSNYGMFMKYAVDDTLDHTYCYWRDQTDAVASNRPTLLLEFAPTVVPEPSALLTLAGFLTGSGVLALRRRK